MRRPGWGGFAARLALAYGVLLQAFANLCACTQDFSSFRFVEAEPARDASGDSSKPSLVEFDSAISTQATSSDAAAAASDSAAPDAAAHDAATIAIDAATVMPPAPPDAGHAMPPGDDDAQVPSSASMCSDAWSASHQPAGACASCACAQCEDSVLGCLTRGTSQERALCSTVLMCALAHGCHDWDCYCTPSRCAMPSLPGDGPCSEEIAAAAGGHDFVSAVHRANDPNHPLIKAIHAIGCSVGVPWGSAGGAVTGKCISQCAP